jgi:F-type H+-transporting ATPase subunit b
MNRKNLSRLAAIAFILCLFLGTVAAQNSESSSASGSGEPAKAASDPNANDANAGISDILTATSEKAAHAAEKWGRVVGVGPKASFSISIAFNFIALFGFFYVLMKSRVPQMFRERTAAIQKGIREAQESSADAARRLSDIEARLSKLGAEVEAMRASAETEAAAEEARIRQAAEEDKQKVVQAAETEIDAIARNARRELKGFAASLAVDLAAQRMNVDEGTDQALVRQFASQLGKDGK